MSRRNFCFLRRLSCALSPGAGPLPAGNAAAHPPSCCGWGRRLNGGTRFAAAAPRRSSSGLVARAEAGTGNYIEEQSFRIEKVNSRISRNLPVWRANKACRLPPLKTCHSFHPANCACWPCCQISFGAILTPIGVSFMVYGFGAFFNLLPGGDISSLLLIYGELPEPCLGSRLCCAPAVKSFGTKGPGGTTVGKGWTEGRQLMHQQ